MFDKYEFELIFDAIHPEAGGMLPGKKFSRTEMIRMLELKVLAYGTEIKHLPTGDIYHVDYRRSNNGTEIR